MCQRQNMFVPMLNSRQGWLGHKPHVASTILGAANPFKFYFCFGNRGLVLSCNILFSVAGRVLASIFSCWLMSGFKVGQSKTDINYTG